MKLSSYQKDILDYVELSDGNLIVQACAGSGKTTTLKEICNRLDRNLSVIALCFNKINAIQFGEKLPKFVDSSTMHSCGLKTIRHHTKGIVVDAKKMDNIFKEKFGDCRYWDEEERELVKVLKKVIPLVRSTMRDISNINDVEDIIEDYLPETTFEYITLPQVCEVGDKVLTECRENRRVVDFDDMIDHVVFHKLSPPKHYDVILGDEVQDWNEQQAEFVRLMASQKKPKKDLDEPNLLDDILSSAGALAEDQPLGRPTDSRVILVGDKNQSIYAFRGADTNSMRNLQETFDCTLFPLSVCYRCPGLVIRDAQAIVGKDEILPCDTADEGEVVHRGIKDYHDTLRALPEGAMVLCRTNAPLLPGALQLIKEGRKACVRGRDIASNLMSLVKKFEPKCATVLELIEVVTDWGRERATKLMRNDAQAAAQAILDQVACIRAVAQECDKVDQGRDRIDSIFSDDIVGVTFSSAHRSKGLEADHIVILGPELMPHPMALKYGTEESLRQERNLKYVAVTRAMKTLVYQPIPPKETDDGFGMDNSLISKFFEDRDAKNEAGSTVE